MASFRPDGRLYDGRGVEVDVEVEPEPEYFIAGGDDEVAAYDAVDGSFVWSAPLSGAAHGLAVDDGVLYVTTDTGDLYCFETASVPGETP